MEIERDNADEDPAEGENRYNCPVMLRCAAIVTLITTSMSEINLSRKISAAVRMGQVPHYTLDLVILGVSILETCAIPLCAMVRYRHGVVVAANLVSTVAGLLLTTLMPASSQHADNLCQEDNTFGDIIGFTGFANTDLRQLLVVSLVGTLVAICRATVTALSLGIIEEAASTTSSLYYGVFIMVRTLSLTLLPRMTDGSLMIVAGITMPMLLNAFGFCCKSSRVEAPAADARRNGEPARAAARLGDVFVSPVGALQLTAASLLGASLWGFLYHEQAIKESRYLHQEQHGPILEKIYPVLYSALIMSIGLFGIYGCTLMLWNRVAATKRSAIGGFLAALGFMMLTMTLHCDVGVVAGLTSHSYVQPACSRHCHCDRSPAGLSPVCDVATMTTYLSPCHAGCAKKTVILGLTVYEECACLGGAGVAADGACGTKSCAPAGLLHAVLSANVIGLGVVGLQATLSSAVSSVAPPGRRAAAAAGLAVVTLTTFVLGHLLFYWIKVSNCTWSVGGVCELQTSSFTWIVGGVSAAMAAGAAAASAGAHRLARREARAAEADRDLELREMQRRQG